MKYLLRAVSPWQKPTCLFCDKPSRMEVVAAASVNHTATMRYCGALSCQSDGVLLAKITLGYDDDEPVEEVDDLFEKPKPKEDPNLHCVSGCEHLKKDTFVTFCAPLTDVMRFGITELHRVGSTEKFFRDRRCPLLVEG